MIKRTVTCGSSLLLLLDKEKQSIITTGNGLLLWLEKTSILESIQINNWSFKWLIIHFFSLLSNILNCLISGVKKVVNYYIKSLLDFSWRNIIWSSFHFFSPQTTVPPFTPSPTECQSTSLVSSSPVLSGSYSSGISSLSRCSVSEASGTELNAGDHPLYPLAPPSTMPNSVSSSSDEPIRRENKTPPPYSVYERNNPRRPVPLPHSLSIPPQVDPPALPPKPHQLRTGSMKLDGTSDPRVPRPRPLPRKVSQL